MVQPAPPPVVIPTRRELTAAAHTPPPKRAPQSREALSPSREGLFACLRRDLVYHSQIILPNVANVSNGQRTTSRRIQRLADSLHYGQSLSARSNGVLSPILVGP